MKPHFWIVTVAFPDSTERPPPLPSSISESADRAFAPAVSVRQSSRPADRLKWSPQLLYSAYTKSLALATENGCRSIAFPLISAGIYGYPLEGAWRKALQACRDYFQKNPEVSLNVVFAVLDDRIMAEGQRQLAEIVPDFLAVHPQS